MSISIQMQDMTFYVYTVDCVNVLKYTTKSADLEAEIKRRIKTVLDEYRDSSAASLLQDWLPILIADPEVINIPKTKCELAKMIIARPD